MTGANGFIGTALCRVLSDDGVKVIAVVRNEEENVRNIEKIEGLSIVYCDLSEFKNLATVIADIDFDVFYHLAWIGSAGPLRGDIDVQMKNVQYTCDTVKACADLGCKRMVFASSIMEYEIGALMATDSTPDINTLYSSAKVAANYMARTIAASMGVDYIRAVISNVYGPGESSPRLVNTSLKKLLKGEHCSFSPGEQIYDFIYITDAAKTFVAIGDKGVANRTYYIGSRNPKPLKEFLCKMRDQVNPTIELGLGDLPFNGISLTYEEFDVNAVEKDTGFVPEVTFEQGIKNTIDWIKEMG